MGAPHLLAALASGSPVDELADLLVVADFDPERLDALLLRARQLGLLSPARERALVGALQGRTDPGRQQLAAELQALVARERALEGEIGALEAELRAFHRQDRISRRGA